MGSRRSKRRGNSSCGSTQQPRILERVGPVVLGFILVAAKGLGGGGLKSYLDDLTSTSSLTIRNSLRTLKQQSNQAGSDYAAPIEYKAIHTNPSATRASDIISILHNAQDSQILVQIRANATCPKPFLVGRLSGPALVKIKEWTIEEGANTTMFGAYRAPVGGQYFVEVVALYCDYFTYQFTQRAKKEMSTEGDWASISSPMATHLRFDFQPICQEGYDNHRLTADDASIVVLDQPAMAAAWSGVWWHKNFTKGQATDALTEATPVFTRSQSQGCFYHAKYNQRPPHCMESYKRLQDYEFRWDQPMAQQAQQSHSIYNVAGRDVSMLKQEEATTVCMMGASHSRRFAEEAAVRMGINNKTQFALNLEVLNVYAEYPHNGIHLSPGQTRKLPRCHKLIIALGQWPASFKGGKPYLLVEYYQALQTLLRHLKETPPSNTMDIFLRSIHYNPLGHQHGSCPPREWRTPPVIEAYNLVTERVAREMNIPFLDASPINGHVWDAAEDWNHLDPMAEEVELLYLLSSALGVEVSPAASQ